jgi:TolB-like protein
MLNKKSTTMSVLFALSLSACSSHPVYEGQEATQSNANWGWQAPLNSYHPITTNKLLSDYTEQLAMKLIENMRYVSDKSPIAVTSFVNLDNNLQTTSVFGNQLAEGFISELQEFGLSVVDYKHTGAVHVTKTGDFSFSRNGDELGSYPEIEYVLSGTLIYSDRGVIVNTRLIGTESKVVVATAKGFIPHFVVNSLYSRDRRDGINLSAVN